MLRVRQEALNAYDFMLHPILHLTDGEGLGLQFSRQRRREMRFRFRVKVVAKDGHGRKIGTRYHDMSCKALAQLIQLNILNTAETITDEGNTGRALTVNNPATLPRIVAGTNSTGAAFIDHVLGTWTDDANHRIAATINAISSNTFTVTGTITNGSGGTITFTEVGIDVTVATFLFLLTHDVFTGLPVSDTGTLTVTYTGTFT